MGEKVGVYLKDTLKMEGDDLVYFYSMTAGKGRGWGAAEVVEHDIKNGKYIARLTGSPWAAPFKDKKLPSNVCSFSCGAVAGVMMAAGSPPVVMEETKCEAKGDDYCEMIARLK
jgi:predicted hydrocarbon binding protein